MQGSQLAQFEIAAQPRRVVRESYWLIGGHVNKSVLLRVKGYGGIMGDGKRLIERGLGRVLIAFVVGLAVGCFFSTYVAAIARSHAGFFTMAGFGEPDYFVKAAERGSS
jgi:hypothetical protein